MPGVVEDDPVAVPVDEAWLLDRPGAGGEGEVGPQAVRLGVDEDAQQPQRLHDLDGDGPDGGGTVARQRADACTETCSPSTTTLNAPSITCRFGYSPSATPNTSDPSAVAPLKK